VTTLVATFGGDEIAIDGDEGDATKLRSRVTAATFGIDEAKLRLTRQSRPIKVARSLQLRPSNAALP